MDLKTSTAPATGNAQVILTVDDILKYIEKEKEKNHRNKSPNWINGRIKKRKMVNCMKPKV